MKNTYSSWAQRLGLLALATLGAVSAQAQALNYNVRSSITRAGTYTDLGTGGTVIATANTDDANSAVLPLGFRFYYNGINFTDFTLNTNGFIKLGTTAPTADFSPYAQALGGGPLASADANLLLPFNTDLTAGSAGGTEYRMASSGTAPNRVLTIQWKNVGDKPRPTSATDATLVPAQLANFSFQLKLHETSSAIEFVYGSATPATGSAAASFTTVGLKGSGSATSQVVLAQKAATAPWASTSFLNAPYPLGANAHAVSSAELPDAGRTYAFWVPGANDAAVTAMQSYGAVLAPGGGPVTIRATVRNAGTAPLTNLAVTLGVTGANPGTTQTQTIPLIAVNDAALVTFTAVSFPNIGTNNVTVRVPADGDNANNTFSRVLVSSATDFSLIMPNEGAATGYGLGPGSEAGFADKFTLNTPRSIVAVRAFIFDYPATQWTASTVGQTVYGVVADPFTGTILARSPDFVVTAAAANALHTFTLSNPPLLPAGDFLVGLVQVSPATSLPFYPMGVQLEEPSRPNLFYTIGGASTNPPQVPIAATSNSNLRYMLEAVTAAPPTCPTPTAVAVSNVTSSGLTVSFTGPANGSSYEVVYVPAGTTPGPGSPTVAGPASPISLSGLSDGTCYDVYLRSRCGATDQSILAGPYAACTLCTPPIISSFPYSQGFEVNAPGQGLACGVTVDDANGDGNTWEATSSLQLGATTTPITRNSSALAMVYLANSDGLTGADDWFYLPAMRLAAGSRYRVSFYYRNNSTNAILNEALEVKYGPNPTAAAQTNLLWTKSNIGTRTYALANEVSVPAVAAITPATTGLYYLGFHAISLADRQFLAVDDVSVTAVLATSEALSRAVNVYPNPSATGFFRLSVQGADAQAPLAVEVTNLLGQRVFTGTARDNFTTELNLSELAAGIYSLRVRSGSEYMQQQLAIVK